MASDLTVAAPRLDMPIVKPNGMLTEFGYVLFRKLWDRSGGVAGYSITDLMDESLFSALAPAGFSSADQSWLGPIPLAGIPQDLGVDPRSFINEAAIDQLIYTTLGISQRFEF